MLEPAAVPGLVHGLPQSDAAPGPAGGTPAPAVVSKPAGGMPEPAAVPGPAVGMPAPEHAGGLHPAKLDAFPGRRRIVTSEPFRLGTMPRPDAIGKPAPR